LEIQELQLSSGRESSLADEFKDYAMNNRYTEEEYQAKVNELTELRNQGNLNYV
jgi:hypothetical protein